MNFPEILISPLVEIMKCLSAPVVQRIVYIKELESNFQMLNEKARHLFFKRDDVKIEINRHETGKVATRECDNWLHKVEEIEHQVNEIEEEYNREDGRCLRGLCLNIQSQWKLGKRVFKAMNRISDLINESNSLKVLADPLLEVVETMPAPTINVQTSTYRTLCKILECVRNPEKHKIAIWGMGGVGKTTVMKNLNNLPELKQIFEIVIWVAVSKDCSIRKIQKDIADCLKSEILDNESDQRVARKLCGQLETKKFLLLMDDVCDQVNLFDVGVPCPNQKDSKFVLTTRYKNVFNQMETDEEIMVEPLPSEEAWKLFRQKVGEVVDLPSIQPVAKSVLAECAGLPLAIVVIGASLRKVGNIHVWDNALKELRSPDTSNRKDMENRVFKILRFNFDRLENDNLRNCFLYAALFPEDYWIDKDEIIDYWMVEGFISSSLNLNEIRSKGHAILEELIDASLLESMDTMHTVKMHDVIRDLALKITAETEMEGCKYFVRAGTMMKQHPENKVWEKVERMSLMDNELSTLPKRPCCPTLLTLWLRRNRSLMTIPKSFFENMHCLRVLDLSGTNIESLPPSICNLVSLCGLYLKNCHHLNTLPPEIGALTSLKVLDATGSTMTNLLSQIDKLAHRRVLMFTFNPYEPKNAVIACGIIARLSLLEKLWTTGESTPRYPGSAYSLKSPDALITGICCLKKLNSLHIFFPMVGYLEYFLQRSSPWKEGSIKEFSFTVGMPNECFISGFNLDLTSTFGRKDRWDRSLTFLGGESITNSIVEVLGYADCLYLRDHRSIRGLCEFGVRNMNGLKQCQICSCIGMKIVLDGAGIIDIVLPNLETLVIYMMLNLKGILNGPLPPGSLANLKTLFISQCHKLVTIFSRDTIRQLSNLEDLRVVCCFSLKEVIHEEAACVMIEFCNLPKLRRLCLDWLPDLVSILNGCFLSCPSLEIINVQDCPNLKCLPQGIDKASNLKEIRCGKQWWDTLEWDHDNAMKGQLEHLVIFK